MFSFIEKIRTTLYNIVNGITVKLTKIAEVVFHLAFWFTIYPNGCENLYKCITVKASQAYPSPPKDSINELIII